VTQEELKGKIVLAPPAALADRWTRRLPDPVTALASGWMRIKQRARHAASNCRSSSPTTPIGTS